MNMSVVHADQQIDESSVPASDTAQSRRPAIVKSFERLVSEVRTRWYVLTLWAMLLGCLLVIGLVLE
jgi:hypothetical protein